MTTLYQYTASVIEPDTTRISRYSGSANTDAEAQAELVSELAIVRGAIKSVSRTKPEDITPYVFHAQTNYSDAVLVLSIISGLKLVKKTLPLQNISTAYKSSANPRRLDIQSADLVAIASAFYTRSGVTGWVIRSGRWTK